MSSLEFEITSRGRETKNSEELPSTTQVAGLIKGSHYPSLPPLKINKGVEGPGGPRGVTGPFSPPSWDRESSDAGHLKYMLPPWRAIASNSERAEDTAGQREEKANVLKKEGARPPSAALRAKQCPPSRILETETLQVSVTEHADGGLAGGSVRVVILSKMCPFLTFSTHLKLDAIKAEAGEPGTRSSAAHLELPESLPSGQTAPAEQGGRGIKTAEHQAETENHGVQAAPGDGVKPPHGRDCEAETAPPGVLRASQRCALCTSREAEGGRREGEVREVREKAEQGLGRAGDKVTPTGPPPPAPGPPLRRLALRREELFASPRLPLQRPRPACAGEARHAGPGGGMSSCNLTIQARRCLAYGKARDGENMKEERGRIFSKIVSVRAERPPFTRPPRRAPANARQPEDGIRSSGGEGRPGPALSDSLASLPSPPYLKRGPGRKEREDPPGVTKPHFPPRKIQDPCDSGERAQAKPCDRNVFEGQDGSTTAVEGEQPPGRLGPRAQQSSPSRARGAGASRWGTHEPESQTQKDKELLMGLKSICSPFPTLPHFKCDLRGEGCVSRIIKLPLSQLPSQESSDAETTARPPAAGAALSGDRRELDKGPPQAEEQGSEEKAEMSREAEARGVDLETKKSPVLRAWTQSDPLRQTEAQAGKRAPGVVAPPTGAPRAAPLAGVEQAGEPTVTRASASSAHFPESSEAEKADQVEPGARELSAPPRHGAGSSPAGGAGHRAGRLLPTRPGKEPPEGEDEPGAVLTAPSSPRRSWRPRRTEDKATQAERDPPALRSSARQRTSEAGEAVPVEPAGGGAIRAVQNEEPREPPREERDRDSTVGQRGETHCTHITLKSTASPRPAVLHRTELHLPLPWRAPRQPQGRGKGPSPALRTVCVSRPPPRSLPVGRGPRVDEERLRAQRPSLLPPTSPASPDAEKAAGSEARGGDARKGRPRRPQSKCGPNLKTVDVNIRVRRREAGVAPVSRILEAQGLVLNVRALTGPRLAGEQDSRIFLTRAFLCTPAALDLEPGSKADKTAPRVAGSSGPRGMLRGASDAQTTAPGEAADGDRALLAERGGGAPQQWTSDFLICVQGRKEPPQVKSKGDLRQLVLNSQDGDVYFTGFGAISSGKRLECLFPGQKAQSEKHKTETLSTFHSCPATKLAKRANQEEEAEPEGNSDCRAGAEGFASQPGETPGSPVSAKALRPPEPNAQPQDTLSKAAPGSADSDSGPNTPGEDGQRDDKVSQAAPAKGPAPQTRESCEDVTAAESSSPPKRNGANVLTTQAVLPSESGPQPGQNASCPLSWPLPKRRQKTPLGTDACKPMLLRPSTRLLPGSHAGAVRRGGARCLLASQQVENILEPLQNFLTPYWAFSPRPADQVGRDECGAGTVLHREQKTLKREKGKLKPGTSMAVHVQERKTGEVSAKKEKLKKGRSNPPKHKGPSLKAAKSPAQTQAMAPRVKSCPGRRKPKKELGGTDQDTQPQTLLPKQVVLDSLYAYIPLPPKFEGWKGRVTMADLRRELSPKYLTINTPGHPVPHILDDLGRGVPSDRMKLEYDFTKPKMFLWRGEGAGVAIRRLSVAVVSPPPTTAGGVSERNPRRGRRIGLSEFPGKSADTREAPGSRISSSTPEEAAPGVPGAAPQSPSPCRHPSGHRGSPLAWHGKPASAGREREDFSLRKPRTGLSPDMISQRPPETLTRPRGNETTKHQRPFPLEPQGRGWTAA
ncbi:leucine-rich repeat transmembrane protein CCDC168-like [Talpa occidentalis]|uniref:leucine-rich repeat transmembrane protein CCDC168-like n=1 Tax=Talpa occidentalis TaxID=50954 RepID=UPI0023F7F1E0|nr:leucine-rich repeat transmembrane protein CCDC168-like [Talpa occidentalis]